VYGRAVGICLATTLFICSVAGFPVPPSSLPASSGNLTLSAGGGGDVPVLSPGAEVEVSGAGFADGASVTVAVYSEPQSLAEVVAGSDGAIDTTVQLPRGLSEGRHTLAAFGVSPGGTGMSLQGGFTVRSAAVATGPTLAYTGFHLLIYLAGGLGLVVVGLVLVRTAAMRRRLLPVVGPQGQHRDE
jgi:hypothetical protein